MFDSDYGLFDKILDLLDEGEYEQVGMLLYENGYIDEENPTIDEIKEVLTDLKIMDFEVDEFEEFAGEPTDSEFFDRKQAEEEDTISVVLIAQITEEENLKEAISSAINGNNLNGLRIFLSNNGYLNAGANDNDINAIVDALNVASQKILGRDGFTVFDGSVYDIYEQTKNPSVLDEALEQVKRGDLGIIEDSFWTNRSFCTNALKANEKSLEYIHPVYMADKELIKDAIVGNPKVFWEYVKSGNATDEEFLLRRMRGNIDIQKFFPRDMIADERIMNVTAGFAKSMVVGYGYGIRLIPDEVKDSPQFKYAIIQKDPNFATKQAGVNEEEVRMYNAANGDRDVFITCLEALHSKSNEEEKTLAAAASL